MVGVAAADTKHCVHCGTENSHDAAECSACGRPLPRGWDWSEFARDWAGRRREDDFAGETDSALLTKAVVELSKIRALLFWVLVIAPVVITLFALMASTSDP